MSAEEKTNGLPLSGVRVLELGQLIAGPFASSLLGDFGADIIKIEPPDVGDALRRLGPTYEGQSLWWTADARNKKSITVNMRTPGGQEIVKDLAKSSDVVVENFRPGTLEKWNLGYEELKKVNPGIIMLRVSGYGQTGPERDKAGFGMTCQARSGLTYMTGFPDSPPLNPAIALADYVTGIFAALSTMIALYNRDTTGEGQGQVIDLAVYEGLFRLQELHTAMWDKLGIIQERCGNDPGVAPPTGMWMSKDGKWVSLTCSNDNVFNRLEEAMGQTELANDPRFANMASRVENRAEINGITQEWIGERTLEEVVDNLMSAGVPAGPVQNMADIFQDRLFWERENIIEVQDPDIGPVKLPNVIGKLSRTPGKVRTTGPRLGQHNDETLKGFLGYSDEKIAALKSAGAI